MSRLLRSRDGFTLIELLVVIAIIGVLSSFMLGAVMQARLLAKESCAQATVRDMQSAISAFGADYGRLPVDLGSSGPNANKSQTLVFALARPGSRGVPYYEFSRERQGDLVGGRPLQYVSELIVAGVTDPTLYPCYYSPLAPLPDASASPNNASDAFMYYYRENQSETVKTGLFNPFTYDLWSGSATPANPGGMDDDAKYGGRTNPRYSHVNNWK